MNSNAWYLNNVKKLFFWRTLDLGIFEMNNVLNKNENLYTLALIAVFVFSVLNAD